MTKILITFLLFMFLFTPQYSMAANKVKGYYKKNGTYVQPYQRSKSNESKLDNYSTKGNINPYTGKKGNQDPVKKSDHKKKNNK